MNNKKALEIINNEGFGIDTMEELKERLSGEETLWGKTENLIIEFDGDDIVLIEREPVVEREVIFENE